MDIDIGSYHGDSRNPVVILIHGLGMDRKIWENPKQSRMLAGSLPISVLLAKPPLRKGYGDFEKGSLPIFPGFTTGSRPRTLRTIFHDLREKDYPVITWTQNRPAGPLEAALEELSEVIPIARRVSKNGIILVGHSRGGLIARKYLALKGSTIKGLITLSTPHGGSAIAQITTYMSPLVAVLSSLLGKNSDESTLKTTAKKVLDFLSSDGVRELLPNSRLFRSLQDQKREGVFYMTIGGTNPSLLTVYRWKSKSSAVNGRRILVPEKVFAIPDILEKIIPQRLVPDEICPGKGDGLVTARSSMIDWCDNHHNFSCNHAEILFDRKVRQSILTAVSTIS
jgi:pimeloyl-ACP methyl ester carboxylesterase